MPPMQEPFPATDTVAHDGGPQRSPVAPDGSWERIEQLRRAVAELETTTERKREALAEQEARWAAAEAQRIHRERLAEARAEFESARQVHAAAGAHADAVLADLHLATCRIAGLYRTAVRAERVRQDAAASMRAGVARLAGLGERPAEVGDLSPRRLVFAPGDPRQGAMLAGLIAYPGTRRELAQLDPPPDAAVAADPGLDELLARVDARRRTPRADLADARPSTAEESAPVAARS